MEDSDFNEFLAYGTIDPMDNYQCGINIKPESIELPADAESAQEDIKCCMQFDKDALQWTFCSTAFPFCALNIRRLARYMKIQCLMFFHTTKYDPNTAPSTEDLEKVEEDKVAKGVWAGWGYYWSMSSSLFRSERPYWIKINDDGETIEVFP